MKDLYIFFSEKKIHNPTQNTCIVLLTEDFLKVYNSQTLLIFFYIYVLEKIQVYCHAYITAECKHGCVGNGYMLSHHIFALFHIIITD